jgi:hypothetical protein
MESSFKASSQDSAVAIAAGVVTMSGSVVQLDVATGYSVWSTVVILVTQLGTFDLFKRSEAWEEAEPVNKARRPKISHHLRLELTQHRLCASPGLPAFHPGGHWPLTTFHQAQPREYLGLISKPKFPPNARESHRALGSRGRCPGHISTRPQQAPGPQLRALARISSWTRAVQGSSTSRLILALGAAG